MKVVHLGDMMRIERGNIDISGDIHIGALSEMKGVDTDTSLGIATGTEIASKYNCYHCRFLKLRASVLEYRNGKGIYEQSQLIRPYS
jgi:hypothetical protein